MAWSIPTYDGVAAHGRPSNLRLAMFELIRGIDERTEALGYNSQYTWWTAASSSAIAAAPTFDDLEFLKCTGNKSGGTAANANKAYRNMVLITDRIEAMLNTGRWRTASGGSTAYTVSSMEAAIGTTLEYPTSVTEARWWQSIQDALDLMIYAYSYLDARGGSRDGYFGSDTTTQLAWDNRADTANTVGLATGVSWRVTPVFGGHQALVTHAVNDFNFNIANFLSTPSTLQGVLVSAEYQYTSTWDDYTLSDFSASIGSDTITVTGAGSGTQSASIPMGSPLSFDLEVVTTEPSTVPFSPTSGIVGIEIDGIEAYHDLSTILTDQA